MDSIRASEIATFDRSDKRTVYYACPYWLWRTDDLSQAVHLISEVDTNLLGVSLVFPERDLCVGQKWNAKAEQIAQSDLMIARPDLKPSPVLGKADCDVFIEAGYAIAKGVPVAWLRHPDDAAMPFMVDAHEAVTTPNVLDAVGELTKQIFRSRRQVPHIVAPDASGLFFSAPYNDKSENRFSVSVKPAAVNAGLYPVFARGALAPGNAVEQVFAKIRGCRCLVADLSQRSANVAVEVGYALGLGIDVALIRDGCSSPVDGNLGGFSCAEFDSLSDLHSRMSRTLRQLMGK